MYESKEAGLEGLTTWQLVHKTYCMLLVESKSLVGVVGELGSDAGEDRVEVEVAKRNIAAKIKTVLRFFETLLVPDDAFSSNLASLYDWYLENLDVLVNRESSSAQKEEAGRNLVVQAQGFVDIWSQLKNA